MVAPHPQRCRLSRFFQNHSFSMFPPLRHRMIHFSPVRNDCADRVVPGHTDRNSDHGEDEARRGLDGIVGA